MKLSLIIFNALGYLLTTKLQLIERKATPVVVEGFKQLYFYVSLYYSY